MLLRAAILLLTAASAFAETRWLTPNDSPLELRGLPWYQENGASDLYRMPSRVKDAIPPAVWNLSRSPSGSRIRFKTDSRSIRIRAEYPGPPSMKNMHAFGQSGIDLYLDGVYWGTVTPDEKLNIKQPGESDILSLPAGAAKMREVTLYLPLYQPVKLHAIGIDSTAKLERAAPFSTPKPIVFYGTSITQGGCASRPGMSYQAILARKLNVDHVNLGFSGNGKGEPAVANAVAEIDAAMFVLDFAQNNRVVDSLREVYEPFLNTLRGKHPNLPILVITPIASSREAWGGEAGPRLDAMRELIRSVAAKRIAAGDRNLQIVEGTDLLGPDRADGLVDGTHPNDLGFFWMAEGLIPRIRQMLR